MTNEELIQHKDKIKKILIDHLTNTINYPNCTDDQIMSQLRNMWVKMEENNLILPGMRFDQFQAHANQAMIMSHFRNIMGI